MAKKAALGKGLSALLPQMNPSESEDAESSDDAMPKTRLYDFEERRRLAGRVAELEVEAIRPNPYQPRKDFDETTLDELAASIRQLGIVQPLTVRALGEGRFELISGERRLRAARRADLRKVPAYVREADTEEMLEMAIVENVQREDLNPIEVAISYQRLMEEVGLTQEQVADRVGKNRSTVANMLRLLRLPPRVQAALRDGSITPGHARMLVSLEDTPTQVTLLREIVDDNLSVRQVEARVRTMKEDAEAPDSPEAASAQPREPDADRRTRLQVKALETRLRDALATQVTVRHKAEGSGRIEIRYHSAEELERILEVVTGE